MGTYRTERETATCKMNKIERAQINMGSYRTWTCKTHRKGVWTHRTGTEQKRKSKRNRNGNGNNATCIVWHYLKIDVKMSGWSLCTTKTPPIKDKNQKNSSPGKMGNKVRPRLQKNRVIISSPCKYLTPTNAGKWPSPAKRGLCQHSLNSTHPWPYNVSVEHTKF